MPLDLAQDEPHHQQIDGEGHNDAGHLGGNRVARALVITLRHRWFPDPAVPQRYDEGSRYAVSSQMACIIVAFPIYLLVMRFILREVERHPGKIESGVRKWLTYIALLVTAGIVICDLITFLAYFLRGGLSVHFVLKALTLIAIAGSIFWYYLGFLKRGAADGE